MVDPLSTAAPPPLSPSSTSATAAAAVASRLNERYSRGVPSNLLSEVGFLSHQFDGVDSCFSPGGEGDPLPWEGATHACARWFDRISATAVSRAMPPDGSGGLPLYMPGLSGWVLSPEHNQLLCAYPFDGSSHHRVCPPPPHPDASAACVPGCTPSASAPMDEHWNGSWRELEQFYPWRRAGMWWCSARPTFPCAHPPHQLREALLRSARLRATWPGEPWQRSRDALLRWGRESQLMVAGWSAGGRFYNELVLEREAFSRHLPHSIEAVFYTPGPCTPIPRCGGWSDVPCHERCAEGGCARVPADGSPPAAEYCEAYARWVHAQLRRRWPHAETPLLVLNTSDRLAPFSVAPPTPSSTPPADRGEARPSASSPPLSLPPSPSPSPSPAGRGEARPSASSPPLSLPSSPPPSPSPAGRGEARPSASSPPLSLPSSPSPSPSPPSSSSSSPSAAPTACLPGEDPRVPRLPSCAMCEEHSGGRLACLRLCRGAQALLTLPCDQLTSRETIERLCRQVGLVNDHRRYLYGDEGTAVIPPHEGNASTGLYQSPSQLAEALHALALALSRPHALSTLRYLELGVFAGWTSIFVGAFLSRFGEGASAAPPRMLAVDVGGAPHVLQYARAMWSALRFSYLDNSEDAAKFHHILPGFHRYPGARCRHGEGGGVASSAAGCAAACARDEACGCATHRPHGGGCWTQPSCEPAACARDAQFSTYVRAARDASALRSPFSAFLREMAANGTSIDVCLIDGDHGYWGVRRDYAQLRARCKIVLFHDVLDHDMGGLPDGGVPQFWAHLRANVADPSRTITILGRAKVFPPTLGIGIVLPNAQGVADVDTDFTQGYYSPLGKTRMSEGLLDNPSAQSTPPHTAQRSTYRCLSPACMEV